MIIEHFGYNVSPQALFEDILNCLGNPDNELLELSNTLINDSF